MSAQEHTFIITHANEHHGAVAQGESACLAGMRWGVQTSLAPPLRGGSEPRGSHKPASRVRLSPPQPTPGWNWTSRLSSAAGVVGRTPACQAGGTRSCLVPRSICSRSPTGRGGSSRSCLVEVRILSRAPNTDRGKIEGLAMSKPIGFPIDFDKRSFAPARATRTF